MPRIPNSLEEGLYVLKFPFFYKLISEKCGNHTFYVWRTVLGLQKGSADGFRGTLQIILDLCIPEKELAKTRSQILFI